MRIYITNIIIVIFLSTLPMFAEVDTDVFSDDITDYVKMDRDFIHLWNTRDHNWNKNEIYISQREATDITVYDVVMHHWLDLMSYEGKLQADTIVKFSVPKKTTYVVSDSYTFDYSFVENENVKNIYLRNGKCEIYMPWTAKCDEVNKVVYFDGKVNIEKFIEFEMALSDLVSMLTNAREKLQKVVIND